MDSNKHARLKAITNKVLATPEDQNAVHNLFLGLRDNNCGRRSVTEIGDFIAHADNRDRGLLSDHASDLIHHMRVIISMLHVKGDPMRTRHLRFSDKEMCSAFRSAYRIIGETRLSTALGISIPELRTRMGRLEKRILGFWNGAIMVPKGKLPPPLERLANTLFGSLGAPPAMTPSSLYDDFIHVLTAHKLITAEQVFDAERLKRALAMTAVAVMHRCRVKVGDDFVELKARATRYTRLTVNVSFILPADSTMTIVTPIVDIDYAATTLIEHSVLDLPHDVPWPHLEMRTDGKLHPLT